ncbi:MAG: LysR family transcriptional regulator [Sphingomonas sp. SCN 67-18]|uniref:LysR substrate-binding domain-containing protein n=1 Tax=uncultured Sphingomonas sp. TaxID=158754 RepID=UPI00086EBBDF|nr:LysR substrate-binding domain-containing protein [Sphingomonas sp. SCN 67-18]ODU22602.1 MAG: LysR family transcriptional regulator [Sphingomonas sp. SCN 67-18]
MRYTLKQLSYFVATGESNSITLASERIHISSPSISSAISHLEAEFGVQLFFRNHAQGLALTPAGERLLVAARQLLREAEGLQDLANEITHDVSGPLRVGTFRTLAPLILPDLWMEFRDLFPRITTRIYENDESELAARLRRAELDVAITYAQAGDDLVFETLALLPTYALVPASHRLASAGSVDLKALADDPFVLLDLPVSRDYFMELFGRVSVKPDIVARSEQPETVRSYVAAGLGYSLMTARPRSLVAPNGKPLAYLRLENDFRPMELGLLTSKNIQKTRAVIAFQDFCRERIATDPMPGMSPVNG